MIEYQGIYKAFDTPVLSGVDLRVERGETLSIIGPSGTGKSVLLKTTLALVVPDRGDVRIGGESVLFSERRAVARLRRNVGYVFQNAALFDSLTVFENIAKGLPEDVASRFTGRQLVLAAAEALEHVNLDPVAVLGKLPAELSGGMRKRVGLARAIIARPQILLYDEPVTGLDPVNAAAVHRLIVRLAVELKATSIIVTHDVEGALSISDRLALLQNGRIQFVGSAEAFRNSNDELVRAFVYREAAAGAAESLAK